MPWFSYPRLNQMFRRKLWLCFAVKLRKMFCGKTKLRLTFHQRGEQIMTEFNSITSGWFVPLFLKTLAFSNVFIWIIAVAWSGKGTSYFTMKRQKSEKGLKTLLLPNENFRVLRASQNHLYESHLSEPFWTQNQPELHTEQRTAAAAHIV